MDGESKEKWNEIIELNKKYGKHDWLSMYIKDYPKGSPNNGTLAHI